LAQVEPLGITRLAAWPVDSIRARIRLNGDPRDLVVDAGPGWSTSREVEVSIDLSGEEAATLRRNLASSFGVQVDFFVSSRWRKTGCLQVVDLNGIDISGLDDGASGAVALSTIKRAVRGLVSRDTKVAIEGECGDAMVGLPPTPQDDQVMLQCERRGSAMHCRYEGRFSDWPTTFATHVSIGDVAEWAY
jgi:hypothetical protein